MQILLDLLSKEYRVGLVIPNPSRSIKSYSHIFIRIRRKAIETSNIANIYSPRDKRNPTPPRTMFFFAFSTTMLHQTIFFGAAQSFEKREKLSMTRLYILLKSNFNKIRVTQRATSKTCE